MTDPAREAEMFREAGGLEREHPLRTAVRDYAGAFIMAVFFALALFA